MCEDKTEIKGTKPTEKLRTKVPPPPKRYGDARPNTISRNVSLSTFYHTTGRHKTFARKRMEEKWIIKFFLFPIFLLAFAFGRERERDWDIGWRVVVNGGRDGGAVNVVVFVAVCFSCCLFFLLFVFVAWFVVCFCGCLVLLFVFVFCLCCLFFLFGFVVCLFFRFFWLFGFCCLYL